MVDQPLLPLALRCRVKPVSLFELSFQLREILSVPAAVAFRPDGALGTGSGAGSVEAESVLL